MIVTQAYTQDCWFRCDSTLSLHAGLLISGRRVSRNGRARGTEGGPRALTSQGCLTPEAFHCVKHWVRLYYHAIMRYKRHHFRKETHWPVLNEISWHSQQSSWDVTGTRRAPVWQKFSTRMDCLSTHWCETVGTQFLSIFHSPSAQAVHSFQTQISSVNWSRRIWMQFSRTKDYA